MIAFLMFQWKSTIHMMQSPFLRGLLCSIYPRFHCLGGFREMLADFQLWGRSFTSLFPQSFEGTKGLSKGTLPELVMSDRTLSFGRLFTTCNGYVGAAICNIQPEDEIFILYGCHIPVVLRPRPDRDGVYELLAESSLLVL
jgi:hypothetical protein